MLDNARLQAALRDWGNGEHNNGLCGLARKFLNEGIDQQTAIMEIQAYYDGLDSPDKRDEHHKEVERAVENVYSSPNETATVQQAQQTTGGIRYVVKETAKPKANGDFKQVCRERQKEWIDSKQGEPAIKAEIVASDVSDRRIKTKDALRAMFQNTAGGHIAQGKSFAEINWMESGDDFSRLNSASRYVTLATFGEKIDEEKQVEADAQGINRTCYLRKNENVQEIACMLLELDEPLGEEVSKDDFSRLSDEEKEAYREKVLLHTAYILEDAGIRPTVVTYSGNRSYHCVFRMAKPVTEEEFGALVGTLKRAYRRMGADAATLDMARSTRMPIGTPQHNALANNGQCVMFVDAGAEIEFVDYVEKIKTLADSICPESALPHITLPMAKETSKAGVETWKFTPTNWEKFLKDIGVELVKLAGGETQLLITDEKGISELVKPEDALDYFVKRMKQVNHAAAASFRYKEASKMKDVCQYAGMCRNANFPKDTACRVIVPFHNGTLEIKADELVFNKKSYCGYDVLESTPTIKRDWELTSEKGEFEIFVERACGMEEQQAEWKDRKKSLMSMLGYMVSTHKIPGANYLCMLTEETMTENEGGTGKSLIMMALNYWRQTAFKDMKFCNSADNRFIFSGFKQGTQVMKFDDMGRDFDFEQLFSTLTGEMRIERKGKDEFYIPFEQSPKFIAATNFFPKGTGNSFNRRVKVFEISNHYNASCTPKIEFGHLLFNDWDDAEWNRFDGFIVRCVQVYLIYGLIEYAGQNIEEKRLMANVKSDLIEFFDNYVASHVGVDISNNDFEKAYNDWCKANNTTNYNYKCKTLKSNLKLYCQTTKEFDIEDSKYPVKINGVSIRTFKIRQISTTNVTTNPTTFNTNPTTFTTNASETEAEDYENSDFLRDAPDFTTNFTTNQPEKRANVVECSSDCSKVKSMNINDLQCVTTNTTMNSYFLYRNEKNSNIYKEVGFQCSKCSNTENAFSGMTASVQKKDGTLFSVAIPEPMEKPWWIFNGVRLSFNEILENGHVIAEVVYCDGRIPEPIEEEGYKYYQVCGSRLKAIDTGILDTTDATYRPVAFVIV